IRVWRTIIVIRQDASQGRPDSEHLEVVPRDNFRGRGAVFTVCREIYRGKCAAEHIFEKLLLLVEITADWVGHQIPTSETIPNLIASPIDQYQSFRLANGKRVQQ